MESPDKTKRSIKDRTNVYKFIGERYIKVTYKELSGEILIISTVDKGKGGENEDRI